MLGCLSADISYLFREVNSFPRANSRKTVSCEEQIMFKDKYPSIFLPQMEAIVSIILEIFFATRAGLRIREYVNNSLHMFRCLSADILCSRKRTICELRGTDNVQGQISEHIFAPNGDYCLYYPSNLFRKAHSFKNWGMFSDIPQYLVT